MYLQREPAGNEYRVPSPEAFAVRQLEFLQSRLTVRFIYALGELGVHTWDLEQPLDPQQVGIHVYKTLLDRAMETVMLPFVSIQAQPFLPLLVSGAGDCDTCFKFGTVGLRALTLEQMFCRIVSSCLSGNAC